MNDKTLPVLKDVIAAIKGNAGISATVGTRVYTDLPQNVAFPCMRVTIQSSPFNTKTETGMESIVQVSIFDRKDSIESVAALRKKVYDLLNRNEAAFTNSSAFMCEFTGTNAILKDTDGQTWQAVSQFRILTN